MSERGIRRAHARRLSRATGTVAGAVLGASALLAPSAEAADVTVTNLNDGGGGSLRDAISTAAAGDTIVFTPGLSGTINAGSEMSITKSLTIQGPNSSAITIDGGDNNRIFRVATATAGEPVSISGLTLANGSAGANSGGAILATNSHLTLDSVTIRDSEAGASSGSFKYDGGGGGVAIFGNNSALTVTGSRIVNNTSADYGGGIETAELHGDLTITGSTLAGNVAAEYGGGLAVYDQTADVVIDKSTITGNDGGTRDGGGVWFEDVYGGSSVTISDSTVSANTTDRAGGGVSLGENFSGPVKIVSTTVTGNSAADGGGIQMADLDGSGSFAITSSTVTGNTATNTAGGVLRGYQLGSGTPSQSDIAVTSTVIAGNLAPNGSPDVGQNPAATGTLTLTNSFLQSTAGATYVDNPVGSSITGADPMLEPLGDNGGPTQTQVPKASSPLVDAGLASGLTNDQRGLTRTVDYPDVSSTHGSDGTDIGAAELQLPPLPPPPSRPTIQFSKPVRDRDEGTATLPTAVSGPGSVEISGEGIATATVRATAAGTVDLPVTPIGPLKKKVKQERKGMVNVTAKFTDATGQTVQDVRRVHLRHKRG